MNRKRALYRYELGYMKWFFVAGLFCSFMALFIHNASLRMTLFSNYGMGTRFFDISYRNTSFAGTLIDHFSVLVPAALLALAIMAIIQFSDYHRRNSREYIVSLPFTQRERFAAKYFVGVGILTAVIAIYAVGVFILRSMYFDYFLKYGLVYPQYRIVYGNDTWLHTLRTMLLLWVVILTAYSIFTLIHSLVAQGVLASLIALGVIATPIYLLYMFWIYANEFSPNYYGDSMGLDKIAQVCGSLIGMGFCKQTVEVSMTDNAVSSYIDYGNIAVVFLVLLVIFIGCTVFAYFINVKQDGAKFGMLIPIPWARVVVSAGAALCFSFPLAAFITFCLGRDGDGITCVVLHAIVCAALFVINQKIFKRLIR